MNKSQAQQRSAQCSIAATADGIEEAVAAVVGR
jgi:hypothetical protein